jgi:serine/threonine-protein kinase RsbW
MSQRSDKEEHLGDSQEMEWCKLIPADFYNLEIIRQFVGNAAEESGFHEDDIYRIQVAVDEAFSNIVEHAYGGLSGLEVVCICRKTESDLEIVLVDEGRPFNPDEIQDPLMTSSLDERRHGGLGLLFMRKWMDEVCFEVQPDENGQGGRNVLTLIKHRPGAVK